MLSEKLKFLALLTLLVITSAGGVAANDLEKQIVIGDSIEAGVILDERIIGVGDDLIFADSSHVDIFSHYLAENVNPDIVLINLSVPVARLDNIIDNQVPKSKRQVKRSDNPVIVFIGGGGNDLRDILASPEFSVCFSPLPEDQLTCLVLIDSALSEAEEKLEVILKKIRKAGDENVTILIRTQYNPFLKASCDSFGILGPLGNLALEGPTPDIALIGFNNRIRSLATEYDALVIDIFGPFFLFPEMLVSDDCIHPTNEGHVVIGNASIDIFDSN